MKKKFYRFFAMFSLIATALSAQDSWTQKANYSGAGQWIPFSFSIGDKGYVGTGADNVGVLKSDFWEYDPRINSWTQKADFGGGVRYQATGFSIGNKGYAGTGSSGYYVWEKDMWEYDPGDNAWRQISDYPAGLRYSIVSFSIGNKGYMGTGCYRLNASYPAIYYNDFWEYDPATDNWTRKADVPEQGRLMAFGFGIGNKGYIGNGIYYYDTIKEDFWEYDPSSNTWTRKADFAGLRREAAAAFTIDNKGYVATGGGYGGLYNDLWEYSPNTNSWLQKATIPGSGRIAGIGFNIGNKGYIGLGGNNQGNLNDFWEYNPYSVTLSCPADKLVSTSSTSCNAVANNIDPIITITPEDFTTTFSYSLTYNGLPTGNGNGSASGLTFEKGTTIVTYTLTDFPEKTCSFNVTVADDMPPLISCPPTQTFCFNSSGNYTVPSLTASDNCGIQNISYNISGATNRTGTGTDASGTFSAGTSIISWVVTDFNGNNSVCSTTVVVDNPLSVSIPDVYAVNPGGNTNTIYIGYGPTSLNLSANGSGGYLASGHNYTYVWSTAATASSINVNPSIVGTHIYTVTITDDYGCTATVSSTITVVDVRCGNKMDKVTICKVPPGNPGNSSVKCVSKNEVAAYLSTGSYLGNCNSISANKAIQPEADIIAADAKTIAVNPNPNNGSFTLQLTNLKDAEIKIVDQNGKTIYRQFINVMNKSQSILINAGLLTKGIYIIQAINNEGIISCKMIVQ